MPPPFAIINLLILPRSSRRQPGKTDHVPLLLSVIIAATLPIAPAGRGGAQDRVRSECEVDAIHCDLAFSRLQFCQGTSIWRPPACVRRRARHLAILAHAAPSAACPLIVFSPRRCKCGAAGAVLHPPGFHFVPTVMLLGARREFRRFRRSVPERPAGARVAARRAELAAAL